MRKATAARAATQRQARGSSRKNLVRVLVDAVERLRRGERPQPQEYIDRHPDLRKEIIRQLAILDLLEEGHMEVAIASARALGWGDARKRLLGRRAHAQRGS